MALVVGALAVAASSVLEDTEAGNGSVADLVNSWAYYPGVVLVLGGGLLATWGWPALYLRMRESAGKLAFVGMLLVWMAAIGTTMAIGLLRLLTFPWMATLPPNVTTQQGGASLGTYFFAMALLSVVGGIAFGIGLLRARFYARTAVVFFMVMVVASLVLGFVNLQWVSNLGPPAYMLGVAWLGVDLFSKSKD